MKLLVTGLNHRTAPVELREQLAYDANLLPTALEKLRRRDGLQEGLILSTCNRVEIAVTAESEADLRRSIEDFIRDTHALDVNQISQHLYHYEDREAIRHLFRVAASLDSMVVGEPQILGQLKAAYASAKAAGSVNGFLETVVTRAFSVAKRVRTETEIGQSAVSISYAAVELAREIFGSLNGKRVMLIGAGKMSELAARHLRRSGTGDIYVTNRTRSRAEQMAEIFGGTIIDYEKFIETLHEMDIVIASSGAPHYILTRDNMKRVLDRRRNKPMFLIDIAVPRNIDPEVNQLDNAFLYDIDDLQRVIENNLKGRLKEAEQAEAIIAEEVDRLISRIETRGVTPTIVGIQESLEKLRMAEVQRLRGKLGTLSPQQEEAVEALTRGIINKIAHGPIAELRRHAGKPDSMQVLEIVRKVFRLGESD